MLTRQKIFDAHRCTAIFIKRNVHIACGNEAFLLGKNRHRRRLRTIQRICFNQTERKWSRAFGICPLDFDPIIDRFEDSPAAIRQSPLQIIDQNQRRSVRQRRSRARQRIARNRRRRTRQNDKICRRPRTDASISALGLHPKRRRADLRNVHRVRGNRIERAARADLHTSRCRRPPRQSRRILVAAHVGGSPKTAVSGIDIVATSGVVCGNGRVRARRQRRVAIRRFVAATDGRFADKSPFQAVARAAFGRLRRPILRGVPQQQDSATERGFLENDL